MEEYERLRLRQDRLYAFRDIAIYTVSGASVCITAYIIGLFFGH